MRLEGLDDGHVASLEREARLAPLQRFLEPRFEEGTDVSEVITRVAGASGADLVVMGTRGRSESAAVLLGSESEQMIMESRMPVLIVKQFGERIGVLRALFDRDFRHEPAPRFG